MERTLKLSSLVSLGPHSLEGDVECKEGHPLFQGDVRVMQVLQGQGAYGLASGITKLVDFSFWLLRGWDLGEEIVKQYFGIIDLIACVQTPKKFKKPFA
ncbi:hypothetical protein L1887_32260 [Cichorium endivia]|nr:hypothetical protein L1887_32260 [Cichorium endivia]